MVSKMPPTIAPPPPSSSPAIAIDKLCAVCGDRALGYNFNAVTCESCKAFFRRNALANKPLQCPFSERCDVTVVTRRFCQRCRLVKCFDIGMRKEYIMSDEDKILKKIKIEQNRTAKRKPPSQPSLSADNSNGSKKVRRGVEDGVDADADGDGAAAVTTVGIDKRCYRSTAGDDASHMESVTPNADAGGMPAQSATLAASSSSHAISSSSSSKVGSRFVEDRFAATSLPSPTSSSLSPSPTPSPSTQPPLPTLESSSTTIVDRLVNYPEDTSKLINHLMRTPNDAVIVMTKIINSQKDAMRLIGHLIGAPGDALKIISKIMNSPFDALTVFTKFMSSPTDALEIIAKIASSPGEVLQFIQQLMHSPEDALQIMNKFMNSPAEALKMLNQMVNNPSADSTTPMATDGGESCSNPIIKLMLDESAQALAQSQEQQPDRHHHRQNLHARPEDVDQQSTERTCPTGADVNANSNAPYLLAFENRSGIERIREILEETKHHTGNDKPAQSANSGERMDSFLDSVICDAISLEYDLGRSTASTVSANRELNDAERAKLNELIVANKALDAPLDGSDVSGLDECSSQSIGNPQDPQLLKIINLTAIAIRRLIQMAKKINAFRNMCQEDQVALLKGGCTEMMILRSAMQYDSQHAKWQLPNSQQAMSSITVDVLRLAKGKVFEIHAAFIRTFEPQWRQDENIILILSAIVLFTPDRPRIVHSDVLRLEQNSYYYLLRRYLESVAVSGCDAKSTFLKLMAKVRDLQRLKEEFVGVYLDVNPEQVEPLLWEMFDLKNR